MSDQFDQEAEALLPHDMVHDSRCPCRYRFAVAARLRSDGKVIDTLRARLAELRKLSQAVIDTDTGPDMNFESLEQLKQWLAANREGKVEGK